MTGERRTAKTGWWSDFFGFQFSSLCCSRIRISCRSSLFSTSSFSIRSFSLAAFADCRCSRFCISSCTFDNCNEISKTVAWQLNSSLKSKCGFVAAADVGQMTKDSTFSTVIANRQLARTFNLPPLHSSH